MAKHKAKTLKRLLALMISLMMVIPAVSLIPVSADADDYAIDLVPGAVAANTGDWFGEYSWTDYCNIRQINKDIDKGKKIW